MPLLVLIIGGILLLWAFYLLARATNLAPRYYEEDEDWDEEDWDEGEDWEEDEEEWEEDKPRRRRKGSRRLSPRRLGIPDGFIDTDRDLDPRRRF